MMPSDDSPKDSSAAPAAQPTGRERRGSDRIPLRSLVEVKIPSWQAFRNVHAVNVSQGGMRISLGPNGRVGIPIDIILTLPNGKRVHLAGVVAHLGGDGSGDIGVRFGDLPPRVLEELNGYIEELRSGHTPIEAASSAGMPSGMLIKKKS